MGSDLISDTFRLAANLLAPLVGVTFFSALLAAFFQGVTQIRDYSFSFFARLLGMSLCLYLFCGYISNKVQAFASGIWANKSFYL